MNKISSKLGIAISITLLYVIVSVLAFKLNIVSFSGTEKDKKEYPVCGTGTCESNTGKNGVKFCSCEGKLGRAKSDCCPDIKAASQKTAPKAQPSTK